MGETASEFQFASPASYYWFSTSVQPAKRRTRRVDTRVFGARASRCTSALYGPCCLISQRPYRLSSHHDPSIRCSFPLNKHGRGISSASAMHLRSLEESTRSSLARITRRFRLLRPKVSCLGRQCVKRAGLYDRSVSLFLIQWCTTTQGS